MNITKPKSIWQRTTVHFTAYITGTNRLSEFTIDPLLDLSLPTESLRFDILHACRDELRHHPSYSPISALPSTLVAEVSGRFLTIQISQDIQAQLSGRLYALNEVTA